MSEAIEIKEILDLLPHRYPFFVNRSSDRF